MSEAPGAYAGTHAWEVFDHVPVDELGRMPAAMAERLTRGALAGAAPVEPRPSATVVPVRAADGRTAAWLLRRRESMTFGGLWAFPGGAVEPGDRAYADVARACAVRELAEETGCTADPAALVPWARWITPEPLAYRFDAWFYLWVVPEGVEPAAGADEATEGAWATEAGELEPPGGEPALMPPTRAVLRELALLGPLGRVLEAAGRREVASVTPRWIRDGDRWRSSYPRRSGGWR